jgi:hypothetical protein
MTVVAIARPDNTLGELERISVLRQAALRGRRYQTVPVYEEELAIIFGMIDGLVAENRRLGRKSPWTGSPNAVRKAMEVLQMDVFNPNDREEVCSCEAGVESWSEYELNFEMVHKALEKAAAVDGAVF